MKPDNPSQKVSQRISRIREQILNIDYVCAGTLLTRSKLCGKPNCRCAQDPAARHGPYFEWSRREGGRLVHSVVSRFHARLLARAIRNDDKLRQLLGRWEHETGRIILGLRDPDR